MRIRLGAFVSMHRIPVTQQVNALRGLLAPCFLWVDRDSPIRGRNLSIELVPAAAAEPRVLTGPSFREERYIG